MQRERERGARCRSDADGDSGVIDSGGASGGTGWELKMGESEERQRNKVRMR